MTLYSVVRARRCSGPNALGSDAPYREVVYTEGSVTYPGKLKDYCHTIELHIYC